MGRRHEGMSLLCRAWRASGLSPSSQVYHECSHATAANRASRPLPYWVRSAVPGCQMQAAPSLGDTLWGCCRVPSMQSDWRCGGHPGPCVVGKRALQGILALIQRGHGRKTGHTGQWCAACLLLPDTLLCSSLCTGPQSLILGLTDQPLPILGKNSD